MAHEQLVPIAVLDPVTHDMLPALIPFDASTLESGRLMRRVPPSSRVLPDGLADGEQRVMCAQVFSKLGMVLLVPANFHISACLAAHGHTPRRRHWCCLYHGRVVIKALRSGCAAGEQAQRKATGETPACYVDLHAIHPSLRYSTKNQV